MVAEGKHFSLTAYTAEQFSKRQLISFASIKGCTLTKLPLMGLDIDIVANPERQFLICRLPR